MDPTRAAGNLFDSAGGDGEDSNPLPTGTNIKGSDSGVPELDCLSHDVPDLGFDQSEGEQEVVGSKTTNQVGPSAPCGSSAPATDTRTDHEMSWPPMVTVKHETLKTVKNEKLDSVHAEGASSAGSVTVDLKRLQIMAADLKDISDAWRAALTSQPNAVEQSLYMLILVHVCTEIFLFHREKYAILAGPENNLDLIVKELRDKPSLLVNILNRDGAEEDLHDLQYPEDAYDKMQYRWDHVARLTDLMEELRSSISLHPVTGISNESEALPSTEIVMHASAVGARKVEEVRELIYKKKDVGTREKELEDILHGLAEMRCCRLYAPPTENEIVWYRQIRMWVTSSVKFLQAKQSWLETWQAERMEQTDIMVQFEVEKVSRCSGGWEFVLPETLLSDSGYLAPSGHKTAMVFDESAEIQLLLRDCKQRLSKMIVRFSEKKGPVNFKDDVNMEDDGRKRKRVKVIHEQDKVKQDLSDAETTEAAPTRSCKPTAGNSDKTRVGYLVDILYFFKSMEFSQSLSTNEVRLYARIMEHVNSSIWLFNGRATHEEKLQHRAHQEMINNLSKGEHVDGSSYTIPGECGDTSADCNPVPETMKRDSREQYLESIMSLVHTIERQFSFSPPSVEVMILYEKIRSCMNIDLLEPWCSQKLGFGESTSGVAGREGDCALARCVQKATWVREIEITDELEKAYEDMLRTIFPKVAEGVRMIEWLENDTETVKDMLNELVMESTQGCKLLDNLLLILNEVDLLFGHIIMRFSQANGHVSHLFKTEQRFDIPLIEGWVSSHVAEAFSSHIANEVGICS